MTRIANSTLTFALGLAVTWIVHWTWLVRYVHAVEQAVEYAQAIERTDHPEGNRSSVAFRTLPEPNVPVAAKPAADSSAAARDRSAVRKPPPAEKDSVYDYFRTSADSGSQRESQSAKSPIEVAAVPVTTSTRQPAARSLMADRSSKSVYSAESVLIDTAAQSKIGSALPSTRSRRWAPISAPKAVEKSLPPPPGTVGILHESGASHAGTTRDPLIPVRSSADEDMAGDDVVYSSTGPVIRVEASGPQQLTIGRPATYVVTLRNQGDQGAKGLFVRLTIPDTVEVTWAAAEEGEVQRLDDRQHRQIVWAFDHLPARSKCELELAIVPKSGSGVDFGIEWTLVPQSKTVRIETIRPELALTLIGPEMAVFGDAPIFTVQVLNQGSGPAEDVSVAMTTSGGRGKSIPIGKLEAGKLTSFKVELAKLPPGLTRLEATATSSLGERIETIHAIKVGKAELQIDSFGPVTSRAGSQVTYEVHVRNIGDANADDVTVTLDLPTSVTPVKLPPAAHQHRGQVTWQIGTVPCGETRSYSIRCDLIEPGDHRVGFAVADGRDNRAASELRTKVAAKPDVRMLVGAGDTKVAVGDEFVYEIHLENHSPTAAQTVQVTMHFAPGMEPVSLEECEARISNGTVMFEPVDELKRGVPQVLRVRARANLPGSHPYRVELTTAEADSLLAYEGLTGAVVASNTEPVSPTMLR